uniref:ZP domain-containing protein n=1 Tax=Chelonoidis abingdonii TaxID=106734 RepID=A0A8C0HBK3_CHEAB
MSLNNDYKLGWDPGLLTHCVPYLYYSVLNLLPCVAVTVQCLVDGHFVLVVSSDMFDHPIILDSVWLAYAQTEYEPIRMTEAFVIFCFPVMQCGTTVQSALLRTGPDGSITRDSTFIVFLPVQVEVFLPPTPAPVTQAGALRLELRIATGRDPIYVEVRILQRTNPNLVLSLHHCWATPSANPLEQPQWPILVDGGVRCPFLGDNYRTQLVPIGSELPFPIHHQRFVLSTFAFVDSASQIALDGEVYLFCSASACCPSWLELCRTMCLSGAAISKSLASTVYPAPLLQTNI